MRFIPGHVIIESLVIIAAATVLGIVVNFFHPKAVPFAWKRPPTVYAADSVLAYELPEANIATDLTTQQSSTVPIVVSSDQVLKLMTTGQAIVLDARAKEDFEKARIEGALNLPAGEYDLLVEMMKVLPRDKWIICYCDGPTCDLSKDLALEFLQNGFTNVAVYHEGLAGWRKFQSSFNQKEPHTDAR